MTPRFRGRRKYAGEVERATPMWQQAAPMNKGRTVAQKQGLRFERRVLESLLAEFEHLIDHLPFLYYAEGRRHAAIPDAICFSSKRDLLTIIEIKHRLSGDGWTQLNLLYHPVVQRAFPLHRIKLLEIVRWYDPAVKLPCIPFRVEDLREWFEEDDLRYGVHIWRE